MSALSSPLVLDEINEQANSWAWQDHQIRYVEVGSGPPVILVHGFGASIGHWRKNIPVLVEAGYRVFALDLLGFGASDKPALDYSLDLWEQLLGDFWQEKVEQPAVWVGNSIGALMCLMIAVHTPEQVVGTILLNCAGGLNHRPEELPPPLRFVMGMFTTLVTSPWVGPFVFDQVRKPARIRQSLTQVYRNPEAITDELVEMLYRPSCDPGAQKVFASILSAPAGPNPEDLLQRLHRPLLVLWGESDPWTPINRGRSLHQYAADPRFQFVPLPDTGHCPHDDRPGLVNPLIVDWLAEYHR